MKAPLLLAAVLLTTPALAQTSEDYAKMSRKVWSIFECTFLAVYTKDNSEAGRLALLGLETGKTYVEATKAGKIKPEDFRNYTPYAFLNMIQGPSTDFTLGRMYQHVHGILFEEISKDFPADEVRNNRARDMYRIRNCSFLK